MTLSLPFERGQEPEWMRKMLASAALGPDGQPYGPGDDQKYFLLPLLPSVPSILSVLFPVVVTGAHQVLSPSIPLPCLVLIPLPSLRARISEFTKLGDINPREDGVKLAWRKSIPPPLTP